MYDEDDYVDAGDGTLVQVKEVTPGRMTSPSGPPRRIVEATTNGKQQEAPTTTPRSPDEGIKQRLNTAFYSGKSQQLFRHKRGMAEYVSGVLGRTVAMEDLVGLSDEELTQVEQALAGVGIEQCQPA